MGFKGPFVDLTSDGEQIWVVATDGRLWSSLDGNIWLRHGDLEKGRPTSIKAIAGAIYAAGVGDDGRGIVWGNPGHNIPLGEKPPELVSQHPAQQLAMDWKSVGQEIDAFLSDQSTYEGAGTGEVRNLIMRAANNGAPLGFFAERLDAKIPAVTIRAFGGNMELRAQDIAHSIILSGMERSGNPEVPASYLTDPWHSQSNSYEKYFEIELSALRAVAASGQNDPKTVEALLARLEFVNDPAWLKSQVIGTLTAISGKHYGYDVISWQNWARMRNKKQTVSK